MYSIFFIIILRYLNYYIFHNVTLRVRTFVQQCTREKRMWPDSPFDAPVSPETAVEGLERTHVGVFRGNDLLREAQATR